MRKKLFALLFCMIIMSFFVSLKQAFAVAAFDEGADNQKIAELDDYVTELEALYLRAVFSNSVPEGFVAVYTPTYIEAGSAVAQR